MLKKEARGRQINSADEDLGLGQEGSRDDLQVLNNMASQGGGPADRVVGSEDESRPSTRRRLNRHVRN